MRDHSKHIQLSREDAVDTMIARLEATGFTKLAQATPEQVSVDEGYGRRLAEDIYAQCDIPNVLTCCMDSIAVHWEDFANLKECELPDTSEWVRGRDWEFANTGIAMPEGFDTAIVIEHVEVSSDEQHVKILVAPSEKFAGTRPAGALSKRGDVKVECGTVITFDVAANIVSAGVANVLVDRKPRVSFLPTGNELIVAGVPYDPTEPEKYAARGKVFESNSTLARGRIEHWGGVYVPFDIVPDDREAIKDAIKRAVSVSDIVVLNAGSSKGSDDWSVEVLEEIGDIICHQVAHGPAHHSFYGIVDGTPVVGVSGPSGGVSFSLGFYLLPLIKLFRGGRDPRPKKFAARLKGSFGENHFAAKKKDNWAIKGEQRPPEATTREDIFHTVKFVRLSVDDKGTLWAKPVSGRPGSPSTLGANAICMLEAGPYSEFPKEGDVIEVELRHDIHQ